MLQPHGASTLRPAGVPRSGQLFRKSHQNRTGKRPNPRPQSPPPAPVEGRRRVGRATYRKSHRHRRQVRICVRNARHHPGPARQAAGSDQTVRERHPARQNRNGTGPFVLAQGCRDRPGQRDQVDGAGHSEYRRNDVDAAVLNQNAFTLSCSVLHFKIPRASPPRSTNANQ
uniref:(northern house mosquito) hypothetical protein n=1 Tax=Culex pipiens TaxID=7175 RepID=A0A8D8KG32_CULPI